MNFYVTMGTPGSGKTHWSTKRHDAVLVSSDAVRTDGVDPKRWFIKMHQRAAQLLEDQQSVVIDACNTTADQRRRWLKLGHDHHAHCVLVAFDTPIATAIERNDQRPAAQRVPHERMIQYADEFATARIVVEGESWDEVLVIRDDGQVRRPRERVPTSRSW